MTEQLDIEQFISQYGDGGIKVARLLHIVDVATTPEKRREAAMLAIAELKRTLRISKYKETLKALKQNNILDIPEDEVWISNATQEIQRTQIVLETEFGSAKTKVKKAETREALRKLGKFYCNRGDLQQSIKHYMKMRDYTSSPQETLDMCLEVISVSFESKSWTVVNQHCTRAEQTRVATGLALGKIKVAQALNALDKKVYESCAKKLLEVPAEIGNKFNEVLPAADIATFACLCALATFDRMTIKSLVLDNTAFRPFLDLVPNLSEVVKSFCNSRYSCLKTLSNMKEALNLNVFLHSHVSGLLDMIWQRALKQYTAPYTTIDLNKMASAFNTSTPLLERSLAQLIIDGQLSARINSETKTLHARVSNQCQSTYERALTAGRAFLAETEEQLRRISMLQHEFEYKEKREESLPSLV
eukprot:TRINITY_DN16828_c0_g1_i1.p1 TRINITY_DN16828_c0_g1~~TRINITY_DN16828_c0_g1_i1.p1  ORF type:complete len:440 (+),score=86.30 TRINITY_DN16828_c0_g1_i1:71-1321(+)